MDFKSVTKSTPFVLALLGAVIVGAPFGLEQIGEATGLFTFPVAKTVKGWFSGGAPKKPRAEAVKNVDWAKYRNDLETFTDWVEDQDVVTISVVHEASANIVIRNDEEADRKLWSVPVTSCTSGDSIGDTEGYVFVSGFGHPFYEGSVIQPTDEKCGYEIVCVGERTVWLRAIFWPESDQRMGLTKFPEFSRVDRDALIRGNRRYVARDAFVLSSGGWLMIDSFLPPDGVVFKILDEGRHVVATLLCVVIGEKGDAR